MNHSLSASLLPAVLLVASLGLAGAASGDPEPAGQAPAEPPRAASPGTGSGTGCAVTLAGRVQSHYETVRDLRAGFSQVTRSVALGGGAGFEQAASGTVHFAKPGRMRWEYSEPEPSLVVSDGKTLWVHDPAAKEVQVLPVGDGFLSGAAIQFLLGAGNLLESFLVTAKSCEAPAVLILTPREPATYERLELQVDADSGAIQRTVVLDLFGNRTEVTFEKVETNRRPPRSLFRFEPPKGTRVLTLDPLS